MVETLAQEGSQWAVSRVADRGYVSRKVCAGSFTAASEGVQTGCCGKCGDGQAPPPATEPFA